MRLPDMQDAGRNRGGHDFVKLFSGISGEAIVEQCLIGGEIVLFNILAHSPRY